jgi:hypothetical protein
MKKEIILKLIKMNTDKFTYKISLDIGANKVCETLALLACTSNGQEESLPIENLLKVFEQEAEAKPTEFKKLSCKLNRNTLIVKAKKDRRSWREVLMIERCEEFYGKKNTNEEIVNQ